MPLKRFKIELLGENFLFNLDGEPHKVGFRTTVFVKAESPEAAEKIAIILVHQNRQLRDAFVNEKEDRARLKAASVEEVSFWTFFRKKASVGISFYSEDEELEAL